MYPQPGGVQLKTEINSRTDEVQVQLAIDSKQIRLLKEPFVEWLDEQELSRRIILKQFKNVLGMTETRGRVGAGTSFSTQAEMVLDFNLNHPAFRGEYNDA